MDFFFFLEENYLVATQIEDLSKQIATGFIDP